MTKDPDPADNDTAFNSFRAKLQGNKVRDGTDCASGKVKLLNDLEPHFVFLSPEKISKNYYSLILYIYYRFWFD